MNPIIIGILGICVLILFLFLRMPVAFAMASIGVVGFSYLVSLEAGLNILARDVWNTFSSYSLTAVPMFIFMGNIAFASGISRRLYKTAYIMFGQMRGGLVIASIAGCAGFAAICGSTTATAAAMGRVALPEMKRYKYDDSFATGCLAAAGGLGPLIPPSTVFIIYGILTEQSIGRLFIAGIFPGLLLATLLIITAVLLCMQNPALGPAGTPTSWKKKISGLAGVLDTLILFILVIGGLFLGWFTPTQAGAAGALGALLLSLAKRQINWHRFLEAVKETVRISCMVYVILAGAIIFGHFIAVARIPDFLADWLVGLPLSKWFVMWIIILVYVIGGCFMDALALIILTIPIIYPAVISLGFDPIWFGVIIVLVGETGVITPPVGINVYVIKGVAPDVPLETIFKGIFPFLPAPIVAIGILMIFPQIATYLPQLVHY